MDFDCISFGCGVNSVALTVWAVERGWRGHIVMADTGCEYPETTCYLKYFQREFLGPRGMEVVLLPARAERPWDLQAFGKTLIEYCEERILIPLAFNRWCTQNWKIRPLQKWQEAHGVSEDRVAVGIAADEAHRLPDRLRPLVDEGISREGCVQIIRDWRLDVPQKSGCYICPFQRVSQWRMLWERHPKLYARAEALEARVGSERCKKATLDPEGKFTLAQLRYGFERQMTLPTVDMDSLLRFKPCVCTL